MPGQRRQGDHHRSARSGSASAIEKAAPAKGAKSIDYDRQVEVGIGRYVSFDGQTVGVLQAKAVIKGLKANGRTARSPWLPR